MNISLFRDKDLLQNLGYTKISKTYASSQYPSDKIEFELVGSLYFASICTQKMQSANQTKDYPYLNVMQHIFVPQPYMTTLWSYLFWFQNFDTFYQEVSAKSGDKVRQAMVKMARYNLMNLLSFIIWRTQWLSWKGGGAERAAPHQTFSASCRKLLATCLLNWHTHFV